ncbi:hypothetical protein C0210_02800 [Moraxella catarrhalis]|nr:hypothetical protein [Moraxella catarrhalis]
MGVIISIIIIIINILKKFLVNDFGQDEMNIENLPKVVDLMIIVNNILKHNFIVILILIGL